MEKKIKKEKWVEFWSYAKDYNLEWVENDIDEEVKKQKKYGWKLDHTVFECEGVNWDFDVSLKTVVEHTGGDVFVRLLFKK